MITQIIKGRFSFILLAVFILAIALRMVSISTRPLWYDEAFSILYSEKGLRAMVYGTLAPANGVASDVHPLAYYTLLMAWMRIFGESLISVRLLSIFIGLGVVAVAYMFSCSLLGRWAALIVALLVAMAPFQVHYSQEIRMYALLTLFLLMATWSMWEGMHTNRGYWWLIFSISAASAQYTHHLAAFYLIPLAFTPIFARRWKAVLPVGLAGVGALLLYLPWLVRLPEQFAKVQQSYWTERPSPARLITTLLSFTTNLPLPDSWLPLALSITILVFIIATYQTIKAVRLGLPSIHLGLWLAYLALTPPLLLFLFSLWSPVYIERALLASGVLYLTWLVWALTQTNLPKMIATAIFITLIIGMGLGIYQHLTYRDFPYAPYDEITQSLRERLSSGDKILHSNKLTMLPAVYYDRTLPQDYLTDPPGSGSDTLALPTQEILGLFALPNLQVGLDDAACVWFLIFSQEIEDYQGLGFSEHPHLEWLSKHYKLRGKETWGDLLIYEYSPE